jgi:ElaA protein
MVTDDAHVTSRSFDELTVHELHAILRLRCDVFIVEQACIYPDIDGRDSEPTTSHHWIDSDKRVVAYLRVLRDADGTARIGRVVTHPDSRGAGSAALLVAHVATGISGELVLDAQSHLAGWYERLGFSLDGEEFVEDDIPHVPMRRSSAHGH